MAALTKTNIQLLSKVQETQSHLEQQQQATYQAELERDGWRLTVSKS